MNIGFVLAPRFTMTALAGFLDALRLAADDGDRSRQINCQWTIFGDEASNIRSSAGLAVIPWEPMSAPGRFDYIAVVGGLIHGGQKVLPGTNSFLRAAARAGVPLIGLCTGSFILARAGLLDGYEVCVSWFHRKEFEAEFPSLRVQSSRMFTLDRDRITCAGGTSVVHLAAHLIEKHCSRTDALKSLRIILEEQPLPSGAWQPEAIVTRQARDDLVRRAMLTIEQDIAAQIRLGDLAESLGSGLRQLERRFIADIGISLRDYRLHLRLGLAKRMLENTDGSITSIGLDCGFADTSYFSRAFARHVGMPPSAFRRQARSVPVQTS
jgi:transcriptional regulator GlxA family with amidase domain